MIADFEIIPPQIHIPPSWKTNWHHLERRMIYPDLRFESLLCLSLPPDFVLDFGWYLHDGKMCWDLQINRGHQGLSDVVVYLRTHSFDEATFELQSWIHRLSASVEVQSRDLDLQKRLVAIEAKLRCYFVPPDGENIDEILPRYMRKLILHEPSSWWQKGSSDAALQFRFRTGVVHSQLILLQRDPYGFHIEYHAPSQPVMWCKSGRLKNKSSDHVTITMGGAPWDLPRNSFVSSRMAANVTATYITDETGSLPKVGNWEIQ